MIAPLKVDNFTGGLTDSPVGAPSSQYQFADNIFLTKTGQIYSRPGAVPFSVAFAQLPTGNQRVGSLWNFNEDTNLIPQSARRAFYFNAGWSELLGPTGNPCFSAGTIGNRVSGSDWKGHLVFTNDGGALPMKIFQDSTTAYRALTLGMPKFLPANAYATTSTVTAAIRDLANELRSQMLVHFANTNYATAHPTPDTGAGSSTAIITSAALVAGDSFATAKLLVQQLAEAYTNHHADAVATKTKRVYHPQIYDNPGAPNIGLDFLDAPKTWLELAQQVNQMKRNFNWHASSFKGHVDTGGPHTPPLVNDRVAGADLANTEQGPTFSDVNFDVLVNFANRLKKNINEHMQDMTQSHPPVNAFTDQTDTENQIYMTDATDATSLFELSVHIYCGYRDHQADASAPVFVSPGVTHHGAGLQNTMSMMAREIYKVKVGMYTRTLRNGTYTGDTFPPGTQVVTVTPTTGDMTLSQNNNNDGADNTPNWAEFSLMKYHAPLQRVADFDTGVVDTNFVADAQKGDLSTFDTGFDIAIGDPGVLSAMLSDITLKFNQHDTNYGFFPVSSTFPGPFIHPNGFGVHQIDPSDIPAIQGSLYGYAFLYSYTYKTLGGETFIVRGTPYFKNKKSYYNVVDSATSIPDLSTFDNTTASLGVQNYDPVAAANINNYDLAGTVVEVYRTIDGGQVLYYAGSKPLGTPNFKDAISDNDIIAEEKIYTNGGVLSRDPPPVCKFFHIMQNGTPYYGGVSNALLDGTIETVLERIQQGVEDGVDAAPESNFVDLPAAVAGISSVRTLPIAFTKNATYRLEGQFDEQGQGTIVPITISDRVGLAGGFSPVQVDGAVIFAGPDQFYLTDGYSMQPLGRAWPTTYANLLTGSRAYNIQGVYDKKFNRAWFGVTDTGAENNRVYAIDLNFKIEGDNGSWSTLSNGSYFAPTALCLFQNQVIRGDVRGYVFKHDESYTSDPRLDLTGVDTSAANWFTRWVPYQYRGAALDFGSSAMRKWAPSVEMKFDNFGNLSVQPTGIEDMGRTTGNCTPIRSRNYIGVINEKRFFPAGAHYFAVKQFEFTLAKTVITNSDALGLVTVTGGTTVTIAAGAFPADMVDHVITFAGDNYTAEFPINNQNGANMVLTTVGAPNGVGIKWEIRGYPKTEKMQMQEYTLWYTAMGVNQTTATGESGANG